MRLDRRRPGQVRLPLWVPALAEPVGTAGGPLLGETQNLSSGGVGLWLKKGMFPGTPVRVTMLLRPGLLLTMAGTAVWVRPDPDPPSWALGMRFGENLPAEMVVGIVSGAEELSSAPAQ